MPDIEPVARAIDYFEDRLHEPCGVADMASSASYSLFHFCRMVNRTTHHTPYDYMMRRRLSEAARELVGTDRRILEIALDFDFNSHETFARAFKRMFGQQPSEFRTIGRADSWHLMPRLTFEHVQHRATQQYLRRRVQCTGAVKISGIMALLTRDPESMADLWGLFKRQLASLGLPASNCRGYGLTYYGDECSGGRFLYLVGMQAGAPDVRHSSWVEKTVPAWRQATFIHRGAGRDVRLTIDYILHT